MNFFTKQKVTAKNNLFSLLDMTYPGVSFLFTSPTREDDFENWGDFAASFWHVDCVRKADLKTFTERYRVFCRRESYNFSETKAR